MGSYRIREVDGEESDDILAELHENTFADAAYLPDFKIGFWWIVYHGKEPVGFAGLVPSQQRVDAGYMIRAGVVPKHRGRGLQKRLIRVREAKARRLGWTSLVSDTMENIRSANNLIRHGFKLYNPIFAYSFDTALYWEKRI